MSHSSDAKGSTEPRRADPIPHHYSDVDTWGGRDRNFFVFACLSLAMGFFGFDHFYLRSFGTGTQKFLVNVFGLGFWYWWDVIQVITEGHLIQKDGLSSPFDWTRGIGRGTFVKPNKQPGTSHKSYLLYTFLAVCFGFLGADKFYLGETWQGVAKLVSCFNIFLLLFGWMWVAWDAFHAFFMTTSVLADGVSPPMPYNYIVPGTVPGHVFKINGGKNNDEEEGCGLFPCPPNFTSFLPTLPIGKLATALAPLAKTLFPSGLGAGMQAPPLPGAPPPSEVRSPYPTTDAEHAERWAASQPRKEYEIAPLGPPSTPDPMGVTGVADVMKNSLDRGGAQVQGGGGERREGGGGMGAVIAGAMTALVVAGGAKGLYDVLNKQFS